MATDYAKVAKLAATFTDSAVRFVAFFKEIEEYCGNDLSAMKKFVAKQSAASRDLAIIANILDLL